MACASFTNGGPSACPNHVRVPRAVLEQRLLASIKADILNGDFIGAFTAGVREAIVEGRARRAGGDKAARQALAKAESVIENIMAAIKAGIFTPTTKAELVKAESERDRLSRQLASQVPDLNIDKLVEQAVAGFQDMIGELELQVPGPEMSKTWELLRAVTGDAIMLKPTKGGGLVAEMCGHYEGLVALIQKEPRPRGRGSIENAGCGDLQHYLLELLPQAPGIVVPLVPARHAA